MAFLRPPAESLSAFADGRTSMPVGCMSVREWVVFFTGENIPIFRRENSFEVLIYPSSFQCLGYVHESTYRVRSRIN